MIRLILLLQWLVYCFCYEHLNLPYFSEVSQLDTKRLNLNSTDPNNHLKHFNGTRVPGSKESKSIQTYITTHFNKLNIDSKLNWTIETHSFEENGYPFTNIIASKSPPGLQNTRYLVLAAHYDTLIKPNGFIGAIDSAVSCSILLDIAETLSSVLDDVYDREEADVGIKLVFFDGEEAIERWSPSDSIYGARNLHSKWSKADQIENIELFVLLDLLGASDVNYVPSYFPVTHDVYNQLSFVENRLFKEHPDFSQLDLASKFLALESNEFTVEFYGLVEDDHIPFLRAGVPILHLIPSPFPKVWHTLNDDFNNVEISAIQRWNIMLRVFVLEFLDIGTL